MGATKVGAGTWRKMYGKRVKCMGSASKLREARKMYRKRVEGTGLAGKRYGKRVKGTGLAGKRYGKRVKGTGSGKYRPQCPCRT